MLAGLLTLRGELQARRVGLPLGSDSEALSEMGVDRDDANSSADYFDSTSVSQDGYLFAIFEQRVQANSLTRFTDGTVPVVYSALDDETCAAEKAHWIPRAASVAPLRYQKVALRFFGSHKDLRQLSPVAECLTADAETGAYALCFGYTLAAVAEHLDGFITPSARRPGGACLPILKRTAVLSITPAGTVSFAFDAATQRWAAIA